MDVNDAFSALSDAIAADIKKNFLLKKEAAAEMLGISIPTLDRIPVSELSRVKLGTAQSSVIRFKLDDIRAYIQSHTLREAAR